MNMSQTGCLLRIDKIFGVKIFFPDYILLKTLCIFHIKSGYGNRKVWELFLDYTWKNKCLRAHSVITNILSWEQNCVYKISKVIYNKEQRVLTQASKNWGKQERKRIQVYPQTVCRLETISIKACTSRCSRVAIRWQKGKSPADSACISIVRIHAALLRRMLKYVLGYLPMVECEYCLPLFGFYLCSSFIECLCIAQTLAFLTSRLISMLPLSGRLTMQRDGGLKVGMEQISCTASNENI